MTRSRNSRMHGILFTDHYQFTMAQLYFRMGLHETEAQFDHFFRRNPDYGSHKAGFCVTAGLAWLVDWLSETRITRDELDHLRGQRTSAGKRLFDDDFLSWLGGQDGFSSIALRAVPEGRVVHPHVPLSVVQGPLAMAQLLETALLNHLNFQTLVATKAARICDSSRGRPVLEFGLRRAQDLGANAGARGALIGGASFTSNVAMSRETGLDAKGTHAHSMVQLFMALGMQEVDAFRAYAESYPDDCLLLVDTIDTLESGVPNAITIFEELKRKGHRPIGVRLDSGDLAYLSIKTAKLLNDAGFADTQIVLSGDLDELVIWQIVTQIQQEAPRYGLDAEHLLDRLVYGVGTRLITSWGEPALGGVYKLVAVQKEGTWTPAIKISDTPAKTPNPGLKSVWRVYDQRGQASADLLALATERPQERQQNTLLHPTDHTKSRVVHQRDVSEMEPLLEETFTQGKQVAETPDLQQIRERRVADVERLDAGVRRLLNPHIYHVSLTPDLWDLKQSLIASARG